MIDARFVEELQLALSRDRLEAYRRAEDNDLEMLTNYFWNIDLAEALVPCLHGVELALRNSIHSEFSHQYDTDMWFYQPGVLDSGGLEKLSEAVRKASHKPPLVAGRVVAAFTFGFWVSLLSSRYDKMYWQPNGYALLKAVFPHAESVGRHDISKRFNEILELRNRVFHYEGIWHRPALAEEHARIHEAIQWINPTLQHAILAVDNFPEVYESRDHVRQQLIEHLSNPG